MSKQSGTRFISEIDLTNYPPFKDGRILFKGENEIQSLIKFYLENKKIVDSESKVVDSNKNAKRFKINCIVGQNGVGKSRLFSKFLDQEGDKVLMDDFSPFSQLSFREQNVNRDLFDTIKKKEKFSGFNDYTNWFIFLYSLFDKIFNFESLFERNLWLNYEFEWKGEQETGSRLFRLDFLNNRNFNERFWIFKSQKSDKGERDKIVSVMRVWKALSKKKGDIAYILEKICIDILQSDYNKKAVLHEIVDEPNLHLLWELSNQKLIESGIVVDDKVKKIINNNYKNQSNFIKQIISMVEELDLSVSDKLLFLEFVGNKVFYTIKLSFEFEWWKIFLPDLSSGERSMILRFTNIYTKILKSNGNQYVILIDEPDLHLHLDWQRQYIQKLIDVFSTLPTDIKLHFVIATHSPFLISDLPTECIVALKKSHEWKTEVLELKKNSTFWANFVDLIRNGFFFKDQMLIWSFTEEIIRKIAKEKRGAISKWKNGLHREIVSLEEMIWDDFLRSSLLYFN